MGQVTDAKAPVIRMYELGTQPRSTGLFGLPMRATFIAGGGLAVGLLVSMVAGLLPGLVVLILVAVAVAPTVIPVGQRTLFEVVQMQFQFWGKKMSGATVYKSGPFSRVPGGTYRLPGVLARTQLHEATDIAGNRFGFIRDVGTNQYTVIIKCSSRGQEALTIHETDMMTRNWGVWLADLSLPGDIVCAQSVIETRPATTAELASEVLHMVDEDAPELARRVMAESANSFAVNQQRQFMRQSITIKASTKEQRTDPEAMATELAQRLPALYATLEMAGVSALPMDAEQIIAFVHESYCPAAERDFEELELSGQDHGLGWEDAGPSSARDHYSYYVHEGCTSVTWEMSGAPEGSFDDRVLAPLVAAHPEVTRKRVAIIYYPLPAGTGTKKVDDEFKNALNAANKSKKITKASDMLRLERAETARQAMVRGSQTGRYSLLVTMTVPEAERVSAAAAIIEQLSARSRLRIHRCLAQQDVAFAAGLGVGVDMVGKTTISGLAKEKV